MKSVELFRFARGDTVWTKARGAIAVLFNSETYNACALKRSSIDEKGDITKANLNIMLPINDDLVVDYLSGAPNRTMSMTMFRQSVGGVFLPAWKGRLVNRSATAVEATLRFESIFTSLARPGLRARFTYQCRHMVYGPGCGLDPEDFRVEGTATAISGMTVLTIAAAAGYDNGYFRGGMLGQPDGTKLFISSHIGDEITVNWPAGNTAAVIAEDGTAAVGLYPGCNLSDSWCDTVFSNTDNFGGFKHIPTRSPFNGSSIA